MSWGTFGILLCLAFPAQDDPAAAAQLKSEAAQALRDTAKAGSFAVGGSLKTEVHDDQTEDEPTVCQVSGSARFSPFEAALRVKAEHNSHEIYWKGGKLAGRLLWRSAPLDLGKAPSELLSLLELDRLALYAEKAAAAQAAADQEAGGLSCRTIRLRLPAEAIRGRSEDNDAAEEDEKGLEGVELELAIDRSTGVVARIAARVRRTYKDPQKPDAVEKSSSYYDLLLGKLGQAKVVIPREIERELKD